MDSDFLRKNNIVDYSLLIGIHKIDETKKIIEDVKKHQIEVKNELNKPNMMWKSQKNIDVASAYNRPHCNSVSHKIKRTGSQIPMNAKAQTRNSFYPSLFEHSPNVEDSSPNLGIESDNSLLNYSVSANELNSESDISLESLDLKQMHPFKDHHDGGISSRDGKEIYYIGIIDMLIQFNAFKKLEFMSKLIYHCSSNMSVVPPEKYRDRFVEYISTIFKIN